MVDQRPTSQNSEPARLSKHVLGASLRKAGIPQSEIDELERSSHLDTVSFCVAAIRKIHEIYYQRDGVTRDRSHDMADSGEKKGAGDDARGAVRAPLAGADRDQALLLEQLQETTARLNRLHRKALTEPAALESLESLSRSIGKIEEASRHLRRSIEPSRPEFYYQAVIQVQARAMRAAIRTLKQRIEKDRRLIDQLEIVRQRVPSILAEVRRIAEDSEAPPRYRLLALPATRGQWNAMDLDPDEPEASLLEDLVAIQVLGIASDSPDDHHEPTAFRDCSPELAREVLDNSLHHFESGGGPFILNLKSVGPGDNMHVRELKPSGQGHSLRLTITDTTILDVLSERNRRDPLTKLLTRSTFDRHLRQQLRTAGGALTAVIMLDLDHFKQINDTFGHARGDVALIQAARAVESAINPTDLVGRLGGEEIGIVLRDLVRADEIASIERGGAWQEVAIQRLFGVLVPPEVQAQLRQILEKSSRSQEESRTAIQALEDARCRSRAEAIRRRIASLDLRARRQLIDGAPEERIPLSASLGAVTVPSWTKPEAALKAADLALYRAKAAGRNRVEIGVAMTPEEQGEYMTQLAWQG